MIKIQFTGLNIELGEVWPMYFFCQEDYPQGSMVENFNYSLREQTRRFSHVDEDMKEFALFYINHQRFLVSKNPRRKAKSPAEIFLDKKLPRWLDLLVEFH